MEVPKTAKLDSSLSLSPQTQSSLAPDMEELSKIFKELHFEKILPL